MSAFIISLDLELYWGVCGSKQLDSYRNNLTGVGDAVNGMLRLFNEFEIKATWASVGFLFGENEGNREFPDEAQWPEYGNERDNTYLMDKQSISDSPDCFYLPGVFERLNEAGQEIGSHSYSHFYSLDHQKDDAAFEADAKLFNKASAKYDNVISYVFPRNQVKTSHLDVLYRNGIKTYRGNDANLIYEKKGMMARIVRFLDSYLPLLGSHGIQPYMHGSGMLNVPASTFLRPFNPKYKVLNKLQIRRIRKAMTACAKKQQSYHLWWHPHNFGTNLHENLAMLEVLLHHYRHLQEKYGMQSMSMGDVLTSLSK